MSNVEQEPPTLSAEEAGISFRPMADADVDEVVAMLQAAFPRWPGIDVPVDTAAHLRWKISCHPLSAETSTVMVKDAAVVAGVVHFVRAVHLDDELWTAATGSDTAVHPRVQGTGLLRFNRAYMKQHFEPLYDFGFNTGSNHPRMQRRAARLGEQISIANGLSTLVRAFDARSFVGVHLKRGGLRHFAGSALAAARGRPSGGSPSAPAVDIDSIDHFDGRFDRLWETARGAFRFVPDRRADYLNWRYLDPRGGLSEVRAVIDGDEVSGYAVLRRSDGNAILADLFALPDRSDVVSALIEDAAEQARAGGSSELSCVLPLHHPYRAVLLEAGFLDAGGERTFRYRPREDRREELAFLEADATAAIHVTAGDFDYV